MNLNRADADGGQPTKKRASSFRKSDFVIKSKQDDSFSQINSFKATADKHIADNLQGHVPPAQQHAFHPGMPGFPPNQMMPAYTMNPTNQSFQPNQMPQGFPQGQMTPGFPHGQMQQGFPPGEMAQGFPSGQMAQGFPINQVSYGLPPNQMAKGIPTTQMHQGFPASQMQQGFPTNQFQQGFQANQMLPSFQVNQMQQGFPSNQALPGFQANQMQQGFQASQMSGFPHNDQSDMSANRMPASFVDGQIGQTHSVNQSTHEFPPNPASAGWSSGQSLHSFSLDASTGAPSIPSTTGASQPSWKSTLGSHEQIPTTRNKPAEDDNFSDFSSFNATGTSSSAQCVTMLAPGMVSHTVPSQSPQPSSSEFSDFSAFSLTQPMTNDAKKSEFQEFGAFAKPPDDDFAEFSGFSDSIAATTSRNTAPDDDFGDFGSFSQTRNAVPTSEIVNAKSALQSLDGRRINIVVKKNVGAKSLGKEKHVAKAAPTKIYMEPSKAPVKSRIPAGLGNLAQTLAQATTELSASKPPPPEEQEDFSVLQEVVSSIETSKLPSIVSEPGPTFTLPDTPTKLDKIFPKCAPKKAPQPSYNETFQDFANFSSAPETTRAPVNQPVSSGKAAEPADDFGSFAEMTSFPASVVGKDSADDSFGAFATTPGAPVAGGQSGAPGSATKHVVPGAADSESVKSHALDWSAFSALDDLRAEEEEGDLGDFSVFGSTLKSVSEEMTKEQPNYLLSPEHKSSNQQPTLFDSSNQSATLVESSNQLPKLFGSTNQPSILLAEPSREDIEDDWADFKTSSPPPQNEKNAVSDDDWAAFSDVTPAAFNEVTPAACSEVTPDAFSEVTPDATSTAFTDSSSTAFTDISLTNAFSDATSAGLTDAMPTAQSSDDFQAFAQIPPPAPTKSFPHVNLDADVLSIGSADGIKTESSMFRVSSSSMFDKHGAEGDNDSDWSGYAGQTVIQADNISSDWSFKDTASTMAPEDVKSVGSGGIDSSKRGIDWSTDQSTTVSPIGRQDVTIEPEADDEWEAFGSINRSKEVTNADNEAQGHINATELPTSKSNADESNFGFSSSPPPFSPDSISDNIGQSSVIFPDVTSSAAQQAEKDGDWSAFGHSNNSDNTCNTLSNTPVSTTGDVTHLDDCKADPPSIDEENDGWGSFGTSSIPQRCARERSESSLTFSPPPLSDGDFSPHHTVTRMESDWFTFSAKQDPSSDDDDLSDSQQQQGDWIPDLPGDDATQEADDGDLSHTAVGFACAATTSLPGVTPAVTTAALDRSKRLPSFEDDDEFEPPPLPDFTPGEEELPPFTNAPPDLPDDDEEDFAGFETVPNSIEQITSPFQPTSSSATTSLSTATLVERDVKNSEQDITSFPVDDILANEPPELNTDNSSDHSWGFPPEENSTNTNTWGFHSEDSKVKSAIDDSTSAIPGGDPIERTTGDSTWGFSGEDSRAEDKGGDNWEHNPNGSKLKDEEDWAFPQSDAESNLQGEPEPVAQEVVQPPSAADGDDDAWTFGSPVKAAPPSAVVVASPTPASNHDDGFGDFPDDDDSFQAFGDSSSPVTTSVAQAAQTVPSQVSSDKTLLLVSSIFKHNPAADRTVSSPIAITEAVNRSALWSSLVDLNQSVSLQLQWKDSESHTNLISSLHIPLSAHQTGLEGGASSLRPTLVHSTGPLDPSYMSSSSSILPPMSPQKQGQFNGDTMLSSRKPSSPRESSAQGTALDLDFLAGFGAKYDSQSSRSNMRATPTPVSADLINNFL